ncbi:MAG: hypothetical protein WC296_02745 [Candidatus Izemoplasmatales bacterium]|jgi:hypothetical protein|nr:hypothetical protein [Candidatus Izemoplasmatales bacterium]MDD4595674.1 hypothetical protein [Candidatus Izemoplasmatales bacterium]
MVGKILEIVMLLCFGVSWPIAAVKTWRIRTAKNLSVLFYFMIFIGYLAGIAAKFANNDVTFVLAAYICNALMVLTNILIYYRNKAIDKQLLLNDDSLKI